MDTSIGPYTVVDVLGHGGFATVYRCIDERLEAEVAIKVLADNHALNPESRSRFLNEGRMLRQIDCRELIQVHDVGETERLQPFLVLELADRGDLATRVAKRQAEGWTPNPDDVQLLVNVLCSAVGALHAHSLIHRDLTPSNILLRTTSQRSRRDTASILDADERMIVADLGFAKDLAIGSGLTATGGTPAFSAPEQFTHGKISPQADVYAVARILQWFVSPVSPTENWRIALEHALQPALSESPAGRPNSAAELAEQLIDSLARQPQSFTGSPNPETTPLPMTQLTGEPAPPSGGPSAPAVRPQARSPKGIVLAAVGLAATLVLVGLAGYWMLGRAPEARPSAVVQETATQNGISVTVDGPDKVPTGKAGVFVASAPDGTDFVWTLPDGKTVADTNAVKIDALSPGRAVIELVATSEGQQIPVRFEFEVVAPEEKTENS